MPYETNPALADAVVKSRQLKGQQQVVPPVDFPALFTCDYKGQRFPLRFYPAKIRRFRESCKISMNSYCNLSKTVYTDSHKEQNMAKTTCYRVQPKGMDLGDHRSQTSNDEADRGAHVFGSVSELCGGVRGWAHQEWKPEIIEIECDSKSLADNGDYEGYVLLGNRGEIVRRKSFRDWNALLEWAKKYPEAL